MRRNRLYCGACGARKSQIVIVAKVPKAKCLKCGAVIPLAKNEYGVWYAVPVKKVGA